MKVSRAADLSAKSECLYNRDSILECNKEIWAGSFIFTVLCRVFLDIPDIENVEKIQDKAREKLSFPTKFLLLQTKTKSMVHRLFRVFDSVATIGMCFCACDELFDEKN